VGTVFTHDHYGPSTHQQVGLYSTLLVEPEGSEWYHNETGVELATRDDGGPTTWQAIIEIPKEFWTDLDGDGDDDDPSHREFYFEYGDFQHAYERGGGALGTIPNNGDGTGIPIPSYADFDDAINPSFRQSPPNPADIFLHPNFCPGTTFNENGTIKVLVPRPCPEAISADDPGTYALNFRNEPIGLRIFEDANLNAILDKGEDLNGNGVLDQVIGDRGDLALAFQSRNDRAIPELNVQPENPVNGADPISPYPPLTADLEPGDPWTPMMRVYMGDRVRIRTQVGAHEEEHNFTIHGLKWLMEPNSPNSGYRNSAFQGINEYFNLDIPFVADVGKSGNPNRVDYLYTVGAETEGWWNGVWGLLRSYGSLRNDLFPVPNSPMEKHGTKQGLVIANEAEFDETCPVGAPVRNFRVYAVRADTLFGSQGLVYNTRGTSLTGGDQGPLIDPTAILYVLEEDLDITPGQKGKGKEAPTPPVINGLKAGVKPEPLILRARAGECIKVQLVNALPSTMIDAKGDQTIEAKKSIGFQAQADMPGFNALPPIIHKDENVGAPNGIVTFNANDMRPSSYVGLHPQLVAYNIRTSDGSNVGDNDFNPNKPGKANSSLVPPGLHQKGKNPPQFNDETYTWYAGDVRIITDDNKLFLKATPVEFGTAGLLSADKIKGSNKGMVGALIIEPENATWILDDGTRAQATVDKDGDSDTTDDQFREFVVVLQNDVNLRYGSDNCENDTSIDCAVPSIAAEGPGVPEDPQDSGQKAINYGAEPLWFRLGIAPDTAFNEISRSVALKDLIPQVFSNDLDIGDGKVGDPQTPVFTADAGDEVRMRVVMPGGHARGITYTVHGHEWQRMPYINDSTEIGHNPDSQYYGTQEGVNPSGHWDFVIEEAGGPFEVEGDYLWRDQASFGSYQGLWGLLRVK
jgi:hypothetical protein